jgi:DNA-binding response OmpR family regulator
VADGRKTTSVTGGPRTRRVLVIDDSATIVEYVRHALQLHGGFEVSVAYNGIEGLNKFYSEKPDCVVVDVLMPGLDGNQVARTIRGDLSSANTPLVILSALRGEDDIYTGMLSGVDAYLGKPFTPAALIAALERVMNITPAERTERLEDLAEGMRPTTTE